jgi:hypothetical protein
VGNREENRQFREAVRQIGQDLGRGLTLDEEDRLHREITGKHYSLAEIVDIGIAMFG